MQLAPTAPRRWSAAYSAPWPGARSRSATGLSRGWRKNRSYLYLRDRRPPSVSLLPIEARIERMIAWSDELLAALADRTRQPGRAIRRAGTCCGTYDNKAARGELTKEVIQGARTQIRGHHRPARLAGGAKPLRSPLNPDRPLALHRRRATENNAQWDLSIHRLGTREGTQPGCWRSTIVPSGSPSVTMSDADRWRHVELLLTTPRSDTSIRIGGLFMLLFA